MGSGKLKLNFASTFSTNISRINYGIAETLAPSHSQWLIPFAVQLIPGGLLFAGTFWLRESPRWLLGQGKRELALKNLCWIRQLPQDHIYIIEEVSFIDAALEEQRRVLGAGFWRPFVAVARNRQTQWRFFLGGMLFLWQNGSGINAINYYSPTGKFFPCTAEKSVLTT